MIGAGKSYLGDLASHWGEGWNSFWFTSSDSRQLCALRVLVGVVALYVISTYGFDLMRLFGPSGMLPQETISAMYDGPRRGFSLPTRFSYLDWLSSAPARSLGENLGLGPNGPLWIGFWAGLLAIACFTIGLWTRITSVLTLLVALSFFHRAPLLTSPEVESVLAFSLAYLCLAPLSDHFAWNPFSRKSPDRTISAPSGRHSTTISCRLLQLHLTLVYLVMGVCKFYGDVWWDGSATWWLSQRPESRLLDFDWLGGGEGTLLLNFWTHAILVYELAYVVFIWNRWTRPLMIALGMAHWFMLALLTGMIPFCFLMASLNLVFIPSDFLKRNRPASAR